MSEAPPHPAQSTAPPPENWPEGVRPIAFEGLDHLGVGEDGALYWDGKPVEVRRVLHFNWWQRVGAVAVALSAVASAGAAVISSLCDLKLLP
jgi:hypothetical protein